jgi:hypothetical protein
MVLIVNKIENCQFNFIYVDNFHDFVKVLIKKLIFINQNNFSNLFKPKNYYRTDKLNQILLIIIFYLIILCIIKDNFTFD